MSARPFLKMLPLTIALAGCGAQDAGRSHTDFQTGMARTDILSRFGPPDAEQTLVKTSPAIFGPIEDFWSDLADGSKVEIWSYRSTWRGYDSQESTLGSSELYFVNDSQSVDGIGFAPEGVVY